MSWKRWCEPGATMPRRTIERVAELSGIGLHTGATTRVSLQPGAAEQGVRFRRSDLPARPEVQARVAEVEATERRTAIGRGDTTIHTVEHLLAAVMALELDDLVIELDGPEPPILDGSFEPWLNALDSAGIRTLPGDPTTYRITRPFTISEGEASYVVSPAEGLRLTTTIEWSHPLRSEERRVGKEYRSGWSPYHENKIESDHDLHVVL